MPLRLLPHGTPAFYLSKWQYSPQATSPTSPMSNRVSRENSSEHQSLVHNALHEEFARIMQPHGGLPLHDSGSPEFVSVWIPTHSRNFPEQHPLPPLAALSPSQPSPSFSPAEGVECVYPLSLVLFHLPRKPSLPKQLHVHSEGAATLGERAKEIGDYIEAVLKEREKERQRKISEKAQALNRSPQQPSRDKDKDNGGREHKRAKLSVDESPSTSSTTLPSRIDPMTSFEMRSSLVNSNMDVESSPMADTPSSSIMMKRPERKVTSDSTNSLFDTPIPMQEDDDAGNQSLHSISEQKPPVQTSGYSIQDTNVAESRDTSSIPASDSQQPLQSRPESRGTWDALMEFGIIRNSGYGNSEMNNGHSNHVDVGRRSDFDFTDDDFSFFENPSVLPSSTSVPQGVVKTEVTPSSSFDLFEAPIPPISRTGLAPTPSGAILTPAPSHHGLPDLTPPHDSSEAEGTEISTPPSNAAAAALLASPRKATAGPFDPILFDEGWDISSKLFHLSRIEIDETLDTPWIAWRKAYEEKTDPRIKIISMLKKQKGAEEDTKTSEQRKPSWSWSDASWESTGTTPPASSGEWDGDSESDSDSDSSIGTPDDNVLGADIENGEAKNGLKTGAMSPGHLLEPPSIRLGSSLLQAGFSFAALRPFISLSSIPLPIPYEKRSPSFPDSPVQTQVLSAPTPVSPGANAVDRMKALELALNVLAAEVTENPVWWEFIRQTRWEPGPNEGLDAVTPQDIWRVQKVMCLLGNRMTIEDLQEGSDVPESKHTISSEPSSLFAPSLTLAQAKSGRIIQIQPTALRFWDKLGIAPRGGPKDCTAYCLRVSLLGEEMSEKDAKLSKQASNWLLHFADAYQGRNFGKIQIGLGGGAVSGVVDARWESSRKTIMMLASQLSLGSKHVIIFVIVPTSLSSLTLPNFRQLLLLLRKYSKQSENILFHFIPEWLIHEPRENPEYRYRGLEDLSRTVYDRVLVPTERSMSRPFFTISPALIAYFQVPSFTLVRPNIPIRFSLGNTHKAISIAERNLMLQVGYDISADAKWLVVVCVDQLGESHQIRVSALNTNADEEEGTSMNEIVRSVWSSVLSFARQASVEWRVIISKRGHMNPFEVQAWTSCLEHFPQENSGPPLRVFLVSVHHPAPWWYIPPTEAPNVPQDVPLFSPGRNLVITDISSLKFGLSLPPGFFGNVKLCPSLPVTIKESNPSGLDQAGQRVNLELKEFVDPEIMSTSALIRVPLGFLSQPSKSITTLLHLHHIFKLNHSSAGVDRNFVEDMQDITKNFHDLTELTRLRWRTVSSSHEELPSLPFHLASIETILHSIRLFSEPTRS